MLHISCPWCQVDEPIDAELLAAGGGRYVCPDCLTCVELVDEAVPELDLPVAA